jgi:DNA polymerase III alpha subunit
MKKLPRCLAKQCERRCYTILKFQNYHRHSYYTNPRISDSATPNEDFAKRAAELGHGIISTAEHGWAGRYIEGYELAQKYGLKFVFGAEAYWVKDRFEKDRTNCHIYLAARNEKGRRALNNVLSEANITGFYAQPRLDVPLLLSLPPDDVIVTSACLAYWRYEDIDDITLRLRDHFEHNFFLEVQYHNFEIQRDVNRHILELSGKYKIPLIMGCDSHYIKPEDAQERTDYIKSKGIDYPDEDGFVLDYPDGDTAYQRFADQCVLNHDQILEAVNNTSVFLEVKDYDCSCFTKDIKMPTLHPEWTQQQRDDEFSRVIWDAWRKEKESIPSALWERYEQEIRQEVDTIHKTKHADYFLIDKAIVERGKELGGTLTRTGRGSSVSHYTNKLLGLTDVDRISARVKMYPERFMSPTRILESKSLADLDLNVSAREPFLQAQKDIMGEESSYEMIAYGTLKPKAAWKMYAKSQDVEFDLANNVSAQIEKYENALKHASEDEQDQIDVLDYIDDEYKEIYQQSSKYQGVVSHMTPHPCATLLYQGNIREEIGLINVKGKICCVMDGKWAEDYKFLKLDWLKVSCVDLVDRIYKRLGRPWHTEQELLELCPPESPVWDTIYGRGCTLGINQVEQTGTAKRVSLYNPKNISELCAFVAAIRPGFKSMYKTFENREPFEYGIKSLDNLIQTPEMPQSFLLYQETAMAVLNYAGIPMSECYEIIKNIAKKRVGKVLAYKERFLKEFEKVLVEQENKSEDDAEQTANQIWTILEDSSRYSFNASHSYCVAEDSLYAAYLKTNYPLYFYEVFLTILEEKGDKDRMNAVKTEAEEYFGISFLPFRFRQDNRTITADTERNAIQGSISAIKGFGKDVGTTLYECGQEQHNSFVSVLRWLDERSIKAAKVEPLIKIDYFIEFGNPVELKRILDIWDFFKQGAAKSIKKEKVAGTPLEEVLAKYATGKNAKGVELKSYSITDMDGLLCECEQYIKSLGLDDVQFKVKIANQMDVLGYIDLTTGKPEDRRKLLISDLVPLKGKDGNPWAYAVFTRSIGTGKTARLTLRARAYEVKPFKKADIIYAASVKKEKSGYWYLYDYDYVV